MDEYDGFKLRAVKSKTISRRDVAVAMMSRMRYQDVLLHGGTDVDNSEHRSQSSKFIFILASSSPTSSYPLWHLTLVRETAV